MQNSILDRIFFSLFFSHLFLHKKIKLSADEALKQKHNRELIILLCINVYEGPGVHRFHWFTHYLIGNIYFFQLMNLQIRSRWCPFFFLFLTINLKMPIFMTDCISYLTTDDKAWHVSTPLSKSASDQSHITKQRLLIYSCLSHLMPQTSQKETQL